MMNEVDHYIATLSGKKQEWVSTLVQFMREAYSPVTESFSKKMPTYEGEGFYIAFAARSGYFSFCTSDEQALSLIQQLSPTAKLGKHCAQLKYSDPAAIEVLMDVIKEVIDYQQAQRGHNITDMAAFKKWNALQPEFQQLIIQNVFCGTCGVTKIVDFTMQNDRFGFVLTGQCEKCGNNVARYVEDEQ